ncbi:hypothetical protein [Janthinobacterium sp. MDB2-8]|uniref:hypothetical protein n=1 Tax=Janthinobacterium sp. MDB2-8 TaxID=1259338 RepID=UPI003F21DC05
MLKKIISIAKKKNFLETLMVIGLRLVSIGVGFAFIKIYTNNLTTDQLGKYFYLITLSYVMNALVFVPVDYYLQARLALSGKDIPLKALLKLNRTVCSSALLLCLAFSVPLLYLGKIQIWDLAGIYATAVFLYLCNFSRGLLNNRGHKIFVVNMLVFESALKIGLFVLAVAYTSASADLLLYSSVAAFALEMLLIAFYFSRKLSYNWSDEGIEPYRTVFRKSYALSIGAVCNLAQLQFYRLMYVWAGAPATAAIYTVVTNLGGAGMTAISSVYSQIFLPKIYASKGKYTLTYIRNALLLAAFVAVGAAIFGQYALMLLTKNDYAQYAQAISYGVLVEAGNMVIGAATVFLMLRNASKIMIFYNIAAAVVSVAGGFVVMTYWPENVFLIGVPIALSQIFIAAFLVLHVAKFDNKE